MEIHLESRKGGRPTAGTSAAGHHGASGSTAWRLREPQAFRSARTANRLARLATCERFRPLLETVRSRGQKLPQTCVEQRGRCPGLALIRPFGALDFCRATYVCRRAHFAVLWNVAFRANCT